jgi:hypothetical protein
VDRAREHLADLNTRIEAFVKNERQVTFLNVEGHKLTTVRPQNVPPPEFSVIVGEVVYNLRAALDYRVYALALLDSGEPQNGTQFPIESRRDGFAARRCGKRPFLPGISDEHAASIEALPPYEGCDWTPLLRDMSNADKLRALHLVTTTGTGRVNVGGTMEEARALGGFVLPGQVGMNFKVTFDVAFDDRTPVLKPLELLESEVRATLEVFKPEFKRA